MPLLGGENLSRSGTKLRRCRLEAALGAAELARPAATKRSDPLGEALVGTTDGGMGAPGDPVGAVGEALLGAVEPDAGAVDGFGVDPLGLAEVLAARLHEVLGTRRRPAG